MSCPYLGMSTPPPGPRRSPGSCRAPDPGRRSSPPGQRSHKEPGREGMRFLAAQSPFSPGNSSLPRSVPPSCLLIISFYSFLKQWLVFFIPLFISLQSAAARLPLIPALPAPFSRRQALRIPAESPPSLFLLSLSLSTPSLSVSGSSEMLSPLCAPLSSLF